MLASEVEPTDENKKDFAANVFGLENVNDIDAINDRIAKVAIASTIGGGTQGTDKFARAVLLGLQNYKQTAAARSSTGGSSMYEAMPRYGEALPSMIKSIMTKDPGISIEEAEAEARKVLDPLYGKTGGGAPAPTQQPQNTEQMPTTPGTRFKDNQTGKIMVVGEDGKPREE